MEAIAVAGSLFFSDQAAVKFTSPIELQRWLQGNHGRHILLCFCLQVLHLRVGLQKASQCFQQVRNALQIHVTESYSSKIACPEREVDLLKFLVSSVVACHVCLVVLAVMQLHDFSADNGFQGTAEHQADYVHRMPC